MTCKLLAATENNRLDLRDSWFKPLGYLGAYFFRRFMIYLGHHGKTVFSLK